MSEQPPAAERPPLNPGPPQPVPSTSDERVLALLAHLLGIFTWFIGALVIWLVKKDTPSFAADQAKEALNFQLTLLIAWAIGVVLICAGIGVLILMAVWVLNIVFCIIACVAAGNGQRYRYPIAIRLIS